MTSAKCSPLCGADRAYGPRVRYWHHEFQCPRRQEMYEALKAADREAEGDGHRPKGKLIELSGTTLSYGPTDQPPKAIGAERF